MLMEVALSDGFIHKKETDFIRHIYASIGILN